MKVAQSSPTLGDPMDYSLPGSSIHGIFQARILEWVAISFSKRSSQPRDWTPVSCIVGRHFTVWATREYRLEPLFILTFIDQLWFSHILCIIFYCFLFCGMLQNCTNWKCHDQKSPWKLSTQTVHLALKSSVSLLSGYLDCDQHSQWVIRKPPHAMQLCHLLTLRKISLTLAVIKSLPPPPMNPQLLPIHSQDFFYSDFPGHLYCYQFNILSVSVHEALSIGVTNHKLINKENSRGNNA